jgi:hypothetical protein
MALDGNGYPAHGVRAILFPVSVFFGKCYVCAVPPFGFALY